MRWQRRRSSSCWRAPAGRSWARRRRPPAGWPARPAGPAHPARGSVRTRGSFAGKNSRFISKIPNTVKVNAHLSESKVPKRANFELYFFYNKCISNYRIGRLEEIAKENNSVSSAPVCVPLRGGIFWMRASTRKAFSFRSKQKYDEKMIGLKIFEQ